MFDPYLSLELDGIEPLGVKKRDLLNSMIRWLKGNLLKEGPYMTKRLNVWFQNCIWWHCHCSMMGNNGWPEFVVLFFPPSQKSARLRDETKQFLSVSVLTCSVDIEENTVMNLWDSVSAYKWYLFGKHTQTPETQMCRFPTINYQPSHFTCHKQIQ